VQVSKIICKGVDLPWEAQLSPWPLVPGVESFCILVHSFSSAVHSVELVKAKMLLKLLFIFSLQWLPIAGQVYFSQPTAGEIINGGVPFIVSCQDSYTAPYFNQMTNFSLLLLAGTYSSPVCPFQAIPESYIDFTPGYTLCMEPIPHFSLYGLQQHHIPAFNWSFSNFSLLSWHQRLHSR
jgi:hypothetical protein